MDATNNITAYGYLLWTVVVKDSYGRGLPAAYILSSEENQSVLTEALQKIKDNSIVSPR